MRWGSLNRAGEAELLINATFFLRPVHAWFSFWDRIVPSIYRVVATGLAALATASVLRLVGVKLIVGAPASLAAWIGLAVAQEHDQRILLPPDRAFVSALTDALSVPPLALTVDTAHGPPTRSTRVLGHDGCPHAARCGKSPTHRIVHFGGAERSGGLDGRGRCRRCPGGLRGH